MTAPPQGGCWSTIGTSESETHRDECVDMEHCRIILVSSLLVFAVTALAALVVDVRTVFVGGDYTVPLVVDVRTVFIGGDYTVPLVVDVWTVFVGGHIAVRGGDRYGQSGTKSDVNKSSLHLEFGVL